MIKNQLCSILPEDFPSDCYINIMEHGKLVDTDYGKRIEKIIRDRLKYGYQLDSLSISMEIFVNTGHLVTALFRIVDDNAIDVLL